MRVVSLLRGTAIAAAVAAGLAIGPTPAQAAVTGVLCDPSGAALKSAIAAASSGDTLVLAGGCLYSFAAPDNDDNAFPVINKTLTIIGNGATIQRAPSAATNFRLFEIDSPGRLTLTSVTLRDGHAPFTGGTTGRGGAIWLSPGGSKSLTLNGSTVTANIADIAGGGIDNDGGTVTLNSSTLSGNTAPVGGGMDMDGGSATFNSSTVANNTATGGTSGFTEGGGLWLSGTVTLNSTRVTGNRSIANSTGFGGGIWVDSGTTTLNSSPVTGNTAAGTNGSGGGIRVQPGAVVNLNSSTVSGNTASGTSVGFGGGIRNFGTVTLRSSPVTNNRALGATAQGGGILNSGIVTRMSSPVTGNIPDQCGTPSTVPGC